VRGNPIAESCGQMIYKHVAWLIAARAVHRIVTSRPFFADLDVRDPLAVLKQVHREWDATTACYATDPKLYMFEVVSLLIGSSAYQQSKPNGKWRKALCLFAPLPEHITASGRLFMRSRETQVAKLAKKLTRRKVVTVDIALALLRPKVV
jgi:hypothetical protein